MKRSTVVGARLAFAALVAAGARVAVAQAQDPAEVSFFEKSLHYTNRGIEFVYAKEHGGLERLTGLTASQVGCVKSQCHVRTCDTCHLKEVNGKATYTLDPAVAQAACERCHGAPSGADVHREKGMKCMACHSIREVHGDGVVYDTYMQPGVLDTRCETCHSNIGKSASHTVHKGVLDCSACHVAEVETCFNCHVESRVRDGKSQSVPLKGMLFLVNHDGKVTTANFLTYVYQNRTLITLAPTFSHSITRAGRKCRECHGTKNVRDISAGTFTPVRWENGRVTNVQGVIPVLEGMRWDVPFLNYEGSKWVPVANPAEPLLNYSGFCTPLTRAQLAKLEKVRGGN
ncbi:MAG TPA: hypothetical protein VMT45_03315 [Thermoanaerobaculaceae bacterium]|nr:hypothetical protein [Thermoanaerobaculaceae bacterium]